MKEKLESDVISQQCIWEVLICKSVKSIAYLELKEKICKWSTWCFEMGRTVNFQVATADYIDID